MNLGSQENKHYTQWSYRVKYAPKYDMNDKRKNYENISYLNVILLFLDCSLQYCMAYPNKIAPLEIKTHFSRFQKQMS